MLHCWDFSPATPSPSTYKKIHTPLASWLTRGYGPRQTYSSGRKLPWLVAPRMDASLTLCVLKIQYCTVSTGMESPTVKYVLEYLRKPAISVSLASVATNSTQYAVRIPFFDVVSETTHRISLLEWSAKDVTLQQSCPWASKHDRVSRIGCKE
jgi:hypothetical protein